MAIGFQPTSTANRPDDEITNDGFFPSLSLAEFQRDFSVPSDVSNEQVLQALVVAMSQVNITLADFKNRHLQQGKPFLTDEEINGHSIKEIHYRQAVYSKTKAALVLNQIDLARRPNAETETKTLHDLAYFYQSQASAAIANIQGKRLIGVSLI